MTDDFVGTNVFLGEFLGRPGGTEELGLDEDLRTNLKFRRRSTAGISRTLITLLSLRNAFSQGRMQFLEISHEIAGMSGSDIPVGMDRDGGIVAFIGIERRDSGGGMRGIVV